MHAGSTTKIHQISDPNKKNNTKMALIPYKKYTAPLRIAHIAEALGIEFAGRGRDIGYLCGNTHRRINMWARCKPVRHPSVGPLSPDRLREAGYGLVPPEPVAMPGEDAWMRGKWNYSPPRGGIDEPYRPSDFDGYDTRSSPPVSAPGTLRISPADNGGTLDFRFGTSMSTIVSADNLTLADFDILSDYYPCVLIMFDGPGSTRYVRCITGNATFGQDAAPQVHVPVSFLLALGFGELTYFMCGCTAPQPELGEPLSGSVRYMALPSERPLKGGIIVAEAVPASVAFERVCAGVKSAGGVFTGALVADYDPLNGIHKPGDEYRYLDVGSDYTVSFRISVANGATALDIPAASVFCIVKDNLAGHDTPAMRAASVLKIAGNRMTDAGGIVLAPNETAQFVISWPRNCLRVDSQNHVQTSLASEKLRTGFLLQIGTGTGSAKLGSATISITH
jgi:hypothetical protein